MVAKSSVLEAFEIRFDHQSARVVLADALAIAGLGDPASFEPKDIEVLCRALDGMGLGRTEAIVTALTGAPPAPAAKAPPAAKAAPEPEPVPEPVSEPEPAPEPEPAAEPEPEVKPEAPAAAPAKPAAAKAPPPKKKK